MSDEFRAHVQQARADIERHLEDARAQFDHTQELINKRTGRDLLGAIAAGLLLGGLLIASLFIWKPLFVLFVAALVAFSAFEFAGAMTAHGNRVERWTASVTAAGAIPLVWLLGVDWLLVIVAGAGVVTLLARPFAHSPDGVAAKSVWSDASATFFVHIYVTLLAGFAVLLTAADGGEWWTFVFITTVVLADTGAYATGLKWGKHKMAPVISPKKSWEGFAGGLVFAVGGGAIMSSTLLELPLWSAVLFSLLVFVTATLGDLSESLIKRDLGIKDMSSILPGHGGMLDRLDSILPSAGLAYLYFSVITVIG